MRRASRSLRRSPTTCCPASAEVPDIRVFHMETPSPYTEFGQKGVGEGGAIGPAAAVANAVNDALHWLGVEICEIPITPRRILDALAAARRCVTADCREIHEACRVRLRAAASLADAAMLLGQATAFRR